MKEIRSCGVCHFGKFTAKTTSPRKTCSTVCSRTYALEIRKKRYDEIKNTVKWKAQNKTASKTHYDKIKNTVWFKAKTKEKYAKDKSTPGWKAKKHEMYMKRKMNGLNDERD